MYLSACSAGCRRLTRVRIQTSGRREHSYIWMWEGVMAGFWRWSILMLLCLPASAATEEIEFPRHGVTLSGSVVIPRETALCAHGADQIPVPLCVSLDIGGDSAEHPAARGGVVHPCLRQTNPEPGVGA